MPERGFDTETWTSDDWFQELAIYQRYLFIYLKTNAHCNQAGLYHITLATLSFETKLPKQELPDLLKSLSPRVDWYPEISVVWVKAFLREQARSPKFIVAAIKSLDALQLPDDIKNSFESYNEELLHGVTPSEHISPTKRECVIIRDNFQCQYCGIEISSSADYEVDHILPVARGGKENYLNLVATCQACNRKKLDKTPQEAGLPTPSPKPFHGAQATYILRTNQNIREKWLSIFPDRFRVVESMLINIDQHYPILTADTHARAISHAHANASAGSGTDKRVGEGVVKREQNPRSRLEAEETLCGGDSEEVILRKFAGGPELAADNLAIISVWCSVKGFKITPADASALVARLRTEFPELDLLAESKTWAARKLSEPLKPTSRPSQQIWNWMRLARKYAEERRVREQGNGQRLKVHHREAFRGRDW